MKKERKFSFLWIIFLIIVIPVLVFNVTIMVKANLHPNEVPDFMGYKPFAVMSGSMQSNILIGDLVIVKKADASEIKENDVIAFRDPTDHVTTHRVIKIVQENNDICFVTKGDNNNVQDDELVCSKSLEGKYAFKIPKVGSFILFIQEPMGFVVMMLSLFVVGLIIFLVMNKQIDKKMSKEDEEYMKEFEEFKRKQKEQKDGV